MIWFVIGVIFIASLIWMLAHHQGSAVNSKMRLMVQRQGSKLVEHIPKANIFFGRDARSRAYLQATLTMLACLTRADGKVTPKELKFVDTFLERDLQLEPEIRDRARHMLLNARIGAVTFERAAVKMKKAFKKNPELLLTQIYILIRLAHVDDEFNFGERMLIERALEIFDIGPISVQFPYSSGLATFTFDPRYATPVEDPVDEKPKVCVEIGAQQGESPFELLGCQPGDSPQVIRRAYLEKVKTFHPDTLLSKGLPEEFIKLAEERFDKIQQAYEEISN